MKKLLLSLLLGLAVSSGYAADATQRVPVTDTSGQTSGFVDKKMKDMGDGTFAEVVSTGSGTNSTTVQGNVASGATDSGNPVKVGGKYNLTPPTYTDGQRGDLQLDNKGSAKVFLVANDGTTSPVISSNQLDAQATQPSFFIQPRAFNGTTWDRQYGNVSAVVLASAARTTTQTGSDITNYNAKGIKVLVNVTVNGAGGSITPSIQIKDANGIYYTVLTGTAILTVTTQTLTIYPGITAAANVSLSDILSRTFRVVITANNANSVTYSVGYELIL